MERENYGLIEAFAKYTSPPGDADPQLIEDDMNPKVGFGVTDNDGALLLTMFLDFSKCEVAERLGQKTMMVAIDELNLDHLEALDLFVAYKLKRAGVKTRFVAD